MEESITTVTREESLARLAADPYVVDLNQEYECDVYRPEDALAVTRCVYNVYGSGHTFDYVYDPEAVKRRFTSGDQYASVARTQRGDILGIHCMYRCAPWQGVYEIGQLMVMQPCKHPYLALNLCKHTADFLYSMGNADALYSEAVCTHVFTQFISRKNRFIECGLELEALPAAVFSLGETGVQGRASMLLYFLVRNDRPHAVYPPTWAESMIISVYHRLKVERSIKCGMAEAPAKSSELSVVALPDVGLIRLQVIKAGNDLVARLAQAEQRLNRGVVQVILNLADPAAPAAAQALRARGYFLGGVMPLWFGTDGLLLQRLSAPPDFEALKIGSADGKAMLRLVREDMERQGEPVFAWGAAP